MKNRPSLKKIFGAFITAAAVTISAPFANAAEPQKKLSPAAAKSQKKAAPKKPQFVPFSPTGEKCPAPPDAGSKPDRLTPSFDTPARGQQKLLASIGLQIGRNKPDGLFNERATQSVNEFRLLTSNAAFRESMTVKNLADLKAFSDHVKQDMSLYNLEVEDATALRFAANRTGVDFEKLLEKKKQGFAPDISTWLYLVDTYGSEYGLGHYAQKIEKLKTETETQLSVSDPIIFEQILVLQNHPRISAMLMAEYIKNKDTIPEFSATLPSFPHVEHSYLQTLGFDLGNEADKGVKGPMTEAALTKFNRLYGPATSFFGPSLPNSAKASETTYLKLFAEQAQKDAAFYGIPAPAAAAIRLANIRTGADFGYMMELSSVESSFDAEAKAATSSATGLYQFTEDTWLHALRRYGEKYDIGDTSAQIEAKDDMYGTLVARVENPFARAAMLELRKDPHLAALMSAEFQMRNKFLVECSTGHEINRTEQYLAHFLGSRGAAHFLNKLKKAPNANAVKSFPAAAAANKPIFYSVKKNGKLQAKTLSEVYKKLDRKFETGNFEDHGIKIAAPNLPKPQ